MRLGVLVNLLLPPVVSSFASPTFSPPLPACASAASRHPLMVAAAEATSDMETLFAVTPEQLSSLRVGTLEATAPPTYEAVLGALMGVADGDEAMAAFMAANRDLLDYRFLYRLTSEKLRAANTGDEALALKLDAARTRAVKAAQRFDAPLFKEVGEAEGRLGGLLAQYMQGNPPSAAAISGAAGESAPAIFAFWMVLIAAMAAWEVKLPIASVEAQAREKLQQLNELREVVEDDAQLLANGGIIPLHTLMAESDALDPATGAQRTSLNTNSRALLDDLGGSPAGKQQIIRKIGCTYCQCQVCARGVLPPPSLLPARTALHCILALTPAGRLCVCFACSQRHGFQAYNPFVQRVAALYDILTHGSLQPLTAVDTKKRPTEVTSRLVKMANDAESILQDQGLEIPLFW